MASGITYYPSLTDADNNTNVYASSLSYVVNGSFGPGSGYINWKMSLRSTGTITLSPIKNGMVLPASGTYYIGAMPMGYFPTYADATGNTNEYGYSSSYTIGADGSFGIANWRIAPNGTGTSLSATVYANGNILNSPGSYFLYPSAPCFLQGTTVLCKVDDVETYVPVEQLKPGTLVRTSLNGYKPIVLVGKESMQNPGHDERIEDRLYKLSPSKYPQLKNDLYITGGHSVLEFPLTEKQTQDTIKKLGDLYVTEGKYRLLACIDERAEPWASEGTYTIWAFALEHDDVGKNYGVYVNGELLVESCSVHFLKKNSNMELIGA
jgi:hypothetical protein